VSDEQHRLREIQLESSAVAAEITKWQGAFRRR
jgi:hypothetical protein